MAADIAFDLAKQPLRALNQFLHRKLNGTQHVRVTNPDGAHSIAVGVDAPIDIAIDGHAGYYAAGMNKQARVTINGNAGPGVAEGMSSGVVWVKGNASVAAGAAAHGGLLVIEGDASLRRGISMKGIDIVVGGNIGDFSGFMAQSGHIVVCGDAGHHLGDSLYEAVIYVRGKIKSFGADAHEEPMSPEDVRVLSDLLARAGMKQDPKDFRRVASKRELYHWNADANQEY